MERKILQEFIEIYRSETSLWKVKSCHYNNKTIKNMAYRKLLSKLRELYPDADIDLVKKKINALRTNFRKELRKVEASRERSKQTGETVYVPSLWYYELFQFIADQESELKGDIDGSIDVQGMLKVEMDESAYYDEESDENFDEEFQASSPESQKQLETGSRMQQSSSMDNRLSLMSADHPAYKRKREMSYSASNDWYPKIESIETYMPNSPSSSSPPMDGREIFGQYVASKLKKMDKPMQLLSERLISEVLFRGQLGELSRKTAILDEHHISKRGDSLQNSH